MARYTLTVSPEYVKSWTIKDALRELLQNCLDQGDYELDITKNGVKFINKDTYLDKSTLLLGGGTKSNDKEKIGQFGEGYKMAMLVLLREGVSVHIVNGESCELWTPKLVNSKVYNSQVLAVDVYKQKTCINELEIVVQGITNIDEILTEIYLDYKDRTYQYIETSKGTILLDEEETGNIYVGGLLIANVDRFDYGYNFKPDCITLGRDRNIVSNHDISNISKKMWVNVDKEHYEKLLTMINKSSLDVDCLYDWDLPESMIEFVSDKFKDKVVAHNSFELERAKEKYGDINIDIVPSIIRDILYTRNQEKYKSIKYKRFELRFKEWYDDNKSELKSNLSDECLDRLDKLYEVA